MSIIYKFKEDNAYTKNKSAQRESCILIIDDEVFIRLSLKKLLVNLGYKVITVQTESKELSLWRNMISAWYSSTSAYRTQTS
jgi:response regulator RpfG family c-di-GMP phosphodiesterase